MKGILTDVSIEGQVRILFHILLSEDWRDFWAQVNLPLLTFRNVGLDREAVDSLVWHTCQREGLVLITGNRNADDPESLEMTLRAFNTPTSLPVFTISDAERVRHSRDYAERVAVKFLDYLLEIDRVRGAGRLFLP